MGRAKLEMRLITKQKSRHLTFKKRKEGLMKKIHEFTTLCDVNACIIIHHPNPENSSADSTEMWPDNSDQVRRMIDLYKGSPDVSGSRNLGLSHFYQSRKKKIQEELEKSRKMRMDLVYPTWSDSMGCLSDTQLTEFATTLANKLCFVQSRIELVKKLSVDNLLDQYLYHPALPTNKVLIMEEPNPPFCESEWFDIALAASANPNETHPALFNYQANMDQEEHHQLQQQIHYVNPGILMNQENIDHYYGAPSDCDIQFASFKHEMLYAPPVGGGFGLQNEGANGFPVPPPHYYDGQTAQPQETEPLIQYSSTTTGDIHLQPNIMSSLGLEYNNPFNFYH